ncbi:MAG: Stp1/IreP family PP2C-type Ser/Thr phosphatase [Chloroflexi bacterium]|nr:Stp1/IreP family PP2C-type Ser/Thr phosphatase [Chloroflexota bacterium]
MPALYSVQIRTHKGSVRDHNEDAVSTVLDWRDVLSLTDEELRVRGHLFAVADGMGGHAAGEVASAVVIEQLFRVFYGTEWQTVQQGLATAISAANDVLCEQADANPDYAGMGTTLVAALLRESDLTIANVGDSRAYLFRREVIRQVTQDHSWVEEQMAAGVLDAAEAARHPYRNVITRSLGPDREPRPDFFHLTTMPGDRILLCTDGLSNLLATDELAQFLSAYPSDEAADILIEQALERGAPDNVTIAVVEMLGSTARVRRPLWPFIVFALVAIIITGFVFRDRWMVEPPQFSTAIVVATQPSSVAFIPTPSTQPLFVSPLPTPSPTSVPTPEPVYFGEPIQVSAIALQTPAEGSPTPDLVERFGALGASGDSLVRIPLPERYVYYLQGPADFDQSENGTLHLQIMHEYAGTNGITYNIPLDENGLSQTDLLPSGSLVGVIARPISENSRSESIEVEPLIVLDRSFPAGIGLPIWVKEGDLDSWLAVADTYWVFTVAGAAGAQGLVIEDAATQPGQPLVLWGGWQQLAETPKLIEFLQLDAAPYILEDATYRQPHGD